MAVPRHHDETIPQLIGGVPAPRIEVKLEREGGQDSSRTVALDGDRLRIGSHPNNDLVITDPKVSRFHCRLERGKTAWVITDCGSKNGLRLNGVPVRDADLTRPECLIEMGDSRFRVRELTAQNQIALHLEERFGSLYGRSVPMRKLFAVLERVAQSDSNVLIEGESGTGKELVATEIVKRGPRANQPFVVVDCGAISPTLVESQLFGHVRGAFTGADRERPGAFEIADGGTVFLDEIGELPLEMQPKLLRVLEARQFTRLGETRYRPMNVRIVAATNRTLEREMNQGRFREDLYFRLAVLTLRVPPLRARLEDLKVLVPAILEGLGMPEAMHLFTPEVLAAMQGYDWPGNVRELRNVVERSVVLEASPTDLVAPRELDEDSLSQEPGSADISVPFRTAKERVIAAFEKSYLSALLTATDGNVSQAARQAGMDRMNLHRLIARYSIRSAQPFRE